MTYEDKQSLYVGAFFESPNGYTYEVLGFKDHADDTEPEAYLHLRSCDNDDIRVYHYSKQPFDRLIKPKSKLTSTQGNPYGISKPLF